MRRLRIARVPYLNSAPFYDGLADDRVEMVDLHPRAMGRAARRGEVDAGLLSLADAFRNAGFEPLVDMGISAKGPVHSVLLFTRGGVERLEGGTLAVTDETSTSVRLLRLLLEEHYDVQVEAYVRRSEGPEDGDAGVLLIGDAALRRAARSGLMPGDPRYAEVEVALPDADPFDEPFPYVMDLCAAWNEWRALPFVFARWMVRRELEPEGRRALAEALSDALDSGLRRLQELAAEHGSGVGLPPHSAYHYLMSFNYRFGPAEREAIDAFRTMLDAAPWWEGAVPLAVRQGEA